LAVKVFLIIGDSAAGLRISSGLWGHNVNKRRIVESEVKSDADERLNIGLAGGVEAYF
jgi:hypothetical protein